MAGIRTARNRITLRMQGVTPDFVGMQACGRHRSRLLNNGRVIGVRTSGGPGMSGCLQPWRRRRDTAQLQSDLQKGLTLRPFPHTQPYLGRVVILNHVADIAAYDPGPLASASGHVL